MCRWGGSGGIHHHHRSSVIIIIERERTTRSERPVDHSDQSVCHIQFHSIPFHYNGDGNPTIREKGERAKWFAKSESCGYEFYHRHKANILFFFQIFFFIYIHVQLRLLYILALSLVFLTSFTFASFSVIYCSLFPRPVTFYCRDVYSC